jgi:hypothetical protein
MGNKLIYDGSSDGRFIAAVKNNSKVQIMTEKSDLIAEFIPDSPSD